ncbi:unnamed protein product, partial [marine sediment metagenome]
MTVHNPRVIRPTAQNLLSSDKPPLDEELAHFVVYLENVGGPKKLELPDNVQWKTIGPATSGAADAALCDMSLATARSLTTDSARSAPDAVHAAAEAVINFCRSAFELHAR